MILILTSIEENERFAAPMCKAFQGRKQVKRKRKGDRHQKQTAGQVCGWCGKTGHDIRGCDNPVQRRPRASGQRSPTGEVSGVIYPPGHEGMS